MLYWPSGCANLGWQRRLVQQQPRLSWLFSQQISTVIFWHATYYKATRTSADMFTLRSDQCMLSLMLVAL